MFPEWHNGLRRWVAPEVREIMDKLHGGDPTCGWEGDPFLDMYFDDRAKRWVLCRHENGTVNPILRSRPGAKLDSSLIEFLITHDTHRGYNVVEDVIKNNRKIERENMRNAVEQMAESADRLKFALRKDIGQHF